jgi:hypothetical protein
LNLVSRFKLGDARGLDLVSRLKHVNPRLKGGDDGL